MAFANEGLLVMVLSFAVVLQVGTDGGGGGGRMKITLRPPLTVTPSSSIDSKLERFL